MGFLGLGGDDSQPQNGAVSQNAQTSTTTTPEVTTNAPVDTVSTLPPESGIGFGIPEQPSALTAVPMFSEPAKAEDIEPGIGLGILDDTSKQSPLPTFNETFGTRAVGLTFNPSQDPLVFQLKEKFAEIIDILNERRGFISSPEVKRLCSVAITEAQTAQMWAVKAVTWND